MRPSSSASIACIASPVWSGFNRFYQHPRRKALPALELPSLRFCKKDLARTNQVLSLGSKLLLVMLVMFTMMSIGIGGNRRTSQNHNSNRRNQQCAQLHRV
jgi:hypothetical protein